MRPAILVKVCLLKFAMTNCSIVSYKYNKIWKTLDFLQKIVFIKVNIQQMNIGFHGLVVDFQFIIVMHSFESNIFRHS